MKTETWKVVYYPKLLNGGMMGVALVEAATHSEAMFAFRQQYTGQYHTVQSCTRLFG